MLVNVTNNQNGREYTVIGNPVKISGYRDSNWRASVPALDEHGDAIRERSKL
jgi:crotonobetainyl-CoA:carnitine CoA-transferase CaiB-like acyl-CoA transferase